MAESGDNPLIYYGEVKRIVTTLLGLPRAATDSEIASSYQEVLEWEEEEDVPVLLVPAYTLMQDLRRRQRSPGSVSCPVMLERTVSFLHQAVENMFEDLFPPRSVVAHYEFLPGTMNVIGWTSELSHRILPHISPQHRTFPFQVPMALEQEYLIGFAVLDDILSFMEGPGLVDFTVAGYHVCQRLSQSYLGFFITFLTRIGCGGEVVCDLGFPEGKTVSHPAFRDGNKDKKEDYMAVFVGIAMYLGKPEIAALVMARCGLYGGAHAILKYQVEEGNPPGANHLAPLTDTARGWIAAVRTQRIGRYKRSLDRDWRLRRRNRPLQLRCPFAYGTAQKFCPQNCTAQCETRFDRWSLGLHLRQVHIFDEQEYLRHCLNCRLVKWKSSEYRTKVEDLNLEMEHALNCYPKNVPCMRGFIESASSTLDGFKLTDNYSDPAVPQFSGFMKVSRPAEYRANSGMTFSFFRTYV